jgi:hypothetical protein
MELHQIEFERFRAFVEDAYRDSIRGNIRPAPMELTQVTMNLDELPRHYGGVGNQSKNSKYVGFAWNGTGKMWVKPGRPDFDMKRTTLHELSHLRVNTESHGPKFRRVFGVALAMYMHSIGKDWVDIRREISAIVYRYRRYRAFTPQGRYNSPRDYQDRCFTEIETITKAAKRVCNVWL